MKNTTSDYDREKLQEELAKLVEGVAVYMRAASEMEIRKRKTELMILLQQIQL